MADQDQAAQYTATRSHVHNKPPSPKATQKSQITKPQAEATQAKTHGETLIRTREPKKIQNLAKILGAEVVAVIKLPSGDSLITLNKPADDPAVSDIASRVAGAKVSPNYTYKAFLTPNDTNFGDQWNLTKIEAPEAWDITTGSSDVTIAVIDTGVLFEQEWGSHIYSQPDFPSSKMWTNSGEIAGNGLDDDGNGFIDDAEGWDFMGGFRGPSADCPNFGDDDTYEDPDDSNFLYMDNDPQPYSCDSPFEPDELNKTHFDGTCDTFDSACAVGHGTMVASVAAAASNNSSLIAGVDHNAKIMNLRVMDGYGFSDSLRIIAAVEYAAEMGADVINMSLGLFTSLDDCSGTDSGLEAAMASAKTAGVTIVAASGNTGTSGVCFPAKSIHAIAVGASISTDSRASFSTHGPELDVLAPGHNVPVANAVSDADPTEYLEVSGTSFASPHVAGLAGLMKSDMPTLTPSEIRKFIVDRADKVAGMNGNTFTNGYGFGRINALSALRGVNYPVNSSFRGGVSVALGDVDGDGVVEIITGSGPGGKLVKIFELSGKQIGSFMTNNSSFLGGNDVAAGDVDDDGVDEIITGAGEGGKLVKVFELDGEQIGRFAPNVNSFLGGVDVATGDVDDDGVDEIITGSGPGGKLVKVFELDGGQIGKFAPYGNKFNKGVTVASGNVAGSDAEEIITGPREGGGPRVSIFDLSGMRVHTFYAYNQSFKGGIRVDSSNLQEGSALSEIFTITQAKGSARIKMFSSTGVFAGYSDYFTDQDFRSYYDVAASVEYALASMGINIRTSLHFGRNF